MSSTAETVSFNLSKAQIIIDQNFKSFDPEEIHVTFNDKKKIRKLLQKKLTESQDEPIGDQAIDIKRMTDIIENDFIDNKPEKIVYSKKQISRYRIMKYCDQIIANVPAAGEEVDNSEKLKEGWIQGMDLKQFRLKHKDNN